MRLTDLSCAQRGYKALSPNILCVLICISFLIIFSATSAHGQVMWSDSWGQAPTPGVNYYEDDPPPNTIPGMYVWGCGITEDNYNTYGHEYYVTTTVTSFNGRTASLLGGGTSYAIAEASLTFDRDDLGEFTVVTEHEIYCPQSNMGTLPTIKEVTQSVSIKYSAYEFFKLDTLNKCVWKKTCNGTCSDDEHTTNPFAGVCFTNNRRYRQCEDGWSSEGGCFAKRALCVGMIGPGFCT